MRIGGGVLELEENSEDDEGDDVMIEVSEDDVTSIVEEESEEDVKEEIKVRKGSGESDGSGWEGAEDKKTDEINRYEAMITARQKLAKTRCLKFC